MSLLLPSAAPSIPRFNGTLIGPDDDGYDAARQVVNKMIDKRPALIARCESVQDVAAALAYARSEDLEVAVRAGSHSSPGFSTTDGGIVIDLTPLKAIHVDPARRIAWVQPGVLWGELDAATQEHGLAVTGGRVSSTGVAGFTIGSGSGWLERKMGLAADNLRAARVLTADGAIVKASETENADLFWALRGGGGNFGIVVEFEFALRPVGPIVLGGMLLWPRDRAREVMQTYRDLMIDAPDSLCGGIVLMSAPPLPMVPTELQGRPAVGVLVLYAGAPDRGAAHIAPLRALNPIVDAVQPMPYTALGQAFDEANAWGQYAYETSTRYAELTDDVVDVMVAQLGGRTSPATAMLSYRLDQAYSEADPDATAFGGTRDPQYITFMLVIAPDAETMGADRTWARGVRDALAPFALNAGTYVNGMAEPDEYRVRAAYGAKYDRLARIKAEYDPGNVFHRNINIKPA